MSCDAPMAMTSARTWPIVPLLAGLAASLCLPLQAQVTSLPFDLVNVADDPQAPDHCGVDFTWLELAPGFGIDAAGVSLADFDSDGLLDIFLPNNKGAPSKLYRNLGGMQFEDVAPAKGVDDPVSASAAALFLDYDHDGDLDLFVTGHLGKLTDPLGPKFKLFRNQGPAGDHAFSDVTAGAGFALQPTAKQTLAGWVSGICAGDWDQDGWVDLFAGWNAYQISANDQWRLLRNAPNTVPGDASDPAYTPRVFNDATLGSGTEGEFGGEPWQPQFWDVNRDGWPDLHVPQDFTLDLLYLNDQDGTFTNVATAVGLNGAPPEFRNEMGLALADFDFDLDLDAHLTNIGYVDRFYRNDSLGSALAFVDIGPATGLDASNWGWGTSFPDLDNDGDLDHVSVCDTVTPVNAPDNHAVQLNLHPLLGADGVNLAWDDVSALLPEFTTAFDPTVNSGRALSPGDLDGDGDLDLVLTRTVGKAGVFENTLVAPHAWLQVDLVEAGGSLETTGARAYLRHGGLTRLRQVQTGSSFLAQEPPRLHFGLGPPLPFDLVGPAGGGPSGFGTAVAAKPGAAGPASGSRKPGSAASQNPLWLVVRWADGACQIVANPPRNTLQVIQRSSVDDTGDLDADGHLSATDQALLALAVQDLPQFEATYPRSPARITGDIDDDGFVDADDLAAWPLLPTH